MKRYFAIRSGKVVEVVPLRGKLYCPISKAETITTDGNKQRAAVEWTISDKKIFETRAEAERLNQAQNASNRQRREKEKEEWRKYEAEREALISELLAISENKGVEVSGIGFMLNEEIREVIQRLSSTETDKV